MLESDIIKEIQEPGRFDAQVSSEEDAIWLIRAAMPDAVELPRATAGQPYPAPPKGVKKWYQVHPAERGVGNALPHVKYADWTRGKKGKGGSWGHISFSPA